MIRESDRSWLFRHPDLDPGISGLAVSATGSVATLGGDDAIRQAVLLLLSTVPGERVMRPHYGCPLDRLVFAPNDATTAGLAIHYVRQAVQRWEPRVEVMRVDAKRHETKSSQLEITLDYRIRSSGRRLRETFPVSLTGEPI